MNSSQWLMTSLGCIAGSFAVPLLAIPLLAGGVACGIAAERRRKYEEWYVAPLAGLEYNAWLDQQQQQIGYTALQADLQLELEHSSTVGEIEALLSTLEFQIARQAQQAALAQRPEPKRIEQEAEPSEPQRAPQQAIEAPAAVLPSVDLPDLPEDPWAVEYMAVPSKATPIEFPVEDIADLIARNPLDRENCGSILIACPKGTGKSNLLRAAIYRLHQLSDGTAQIAIFNGKEDRDESGTITSTFCGLENDKHRYINAGDPDEAGVTYSRLAQATEAMEKNHSTPMVQILDEYNNILIAAEIYTSILRDERSMLPFKERRDAPPVPNYVEKIGLGTVLRITKGRSKLTADWITSHSPLVQDIGLNTKIQQSLTTVVLGRGDKLDALHSALSGSQPVVKNPQARAQLYDSFLQWEETGDMNRVICLTNLAGKWRLCFLPRYPDVQPDVFSDHAVDVPD